MLIPSACSVALASEKHSGRPSTASTRPRREGRARAMATLAGRRLRFAFVEFLVAESAFALQVPACAIYCSVLSSLL